MSYIVMINRALLTMFMVMMVAATAFIVSAVVKCIKDMWRDA